MMTDTILLFLIIMLSLTLPYFIFPEARHYITEYVSKQVLYNLQYERTVATRFNILFDYVSSIALPVVIAVVIYLYSKKRDKFHPNKNRYFSIALLFLLISISGVIPIMISVKQRPFYILTTYPFFALAMGFLLFPYITRLIQNENIFKPLKYTALTLFTLCIGLSYYFSKQTGRDKTLINDIKKVIQYTGKDTDIGISPELFNHWELHGYFYRYGLISLDANPEHRKRFYLCQKEANDNLYRNYKKVFIPLNNFILFERYPVYLNKQ